MLVRADGVTRTGWALRDPKTGSMTLADICEDQREALELRRQRATHQSHDSRMQLVPVMITISAAA